MSSCSLLHLYTLSPFLLWSVTHLTSAVVVAFALLFLSPPLHVFHLQSSFLTFPAHCATFPFFLSQRSKLLLCPLAYKHPTRTNTQMHPEHAPAFLSLLWFVDTATPEEVTRAGRSRALAGSV